MENPYLMYRREFLRKAGRFLLIVTAAGSSSCLTLQVEKNRKRFIEYRKNNCDPNKISDEFGISGWTEEERIIYKNFSEEVQRMGIDELSNVDLPYLPENTSKHLKGEAFFERHKRWGEAFYRQIRCRAADIGISGE